MYNDTAHSYRMPPSIEHILDVQAQSSSVLLNAPTTDALVMPATAYVAVIGRVLPIDEAAEQAVDAWIAARPVKREKLLLTRK